jgi:hypothetical protein
MKKPNIKTFIPISAVAAVFGLAASAANAQTSFSAAFPASWNGTGTTVTDLSGGGTTGFQSGTAAYTTAVVPPGALAGTGSMGLTGVGGIKVTPADWLNNAAIWNAGGFNYNIDFLWNGTDSTAFSHIQKLIDYAGTESLQLVTSAGSATLEMDFNGNATPVVSTTISPNTWYNVSMDFVASSLSGTNLYGTANLYVNGSLVNSASATKTTYGDSLDRPVGIGEFGYGHTTSIIGLDGDIYSASIQIPEPSTLGLGVLGSFGMLLFRRRKS